ncbi:MAG TPA: peptidase M61, partial [Chitinophagaceae bacterium]|nr:peptidase M61 [Chitinophagaceae bacterium]
MHFLRSSLFALGLSLSGLAGAQQAYRYTVDLNQTGDDRLQVELAVPATGKSTAVFQFPKIIPGTYSISDYGQFISAVKAFDKGGKALPVSRIDTNRWRISNAAGLARITYTVEDIFDAQGKHNVYPMAATNIEAGKNYVLHNPGVFGFLEGGNKLPFEITIAKPAGFYASTALKPVRSTDAQDVFRTASVDELYDAPIMYTVPDTTTVRVGNTDVLISVYAPKGLIKSKEVAGWLQELL